MKTRNQGFTLIELLVVIAIIAILAAILFPAFSKAKQTAQAATCIAGAKQLGTGLLLYEDNNNGVICPSTFEKNDSNYKDTYRVWRAIVWPYVRSYNAYICPSMPKEAKTWGWSYGGQGGAARVPLNDIPTTYALNQVVASRNSDFQGHEFHRISQYARPSRMILFTEIRNGKWSSDYGNLSGKESDGVLNLVRYVPRNHFNKFTVAFLDGHARTILAWDTVGSTVDEWMWSDSFRNPTLVVGILAQQTLIKSEWPSNYPPKGGM